MSTKRDPDVNVSQIDFCKKKKRADDETKDFAPFIRHPADVVSNQNFCFRCRAIDFRAIFSLDGRKLPLDGLPVFDIHLSASLVGSACLLCRMLATMAFSTERRLPEPSPNDLKDGQWFHLRAYSQTVFWNSTAKTRRTKRKPIVVGLGGRRPFVAWYRSLNVELFRHGVIQPSCSAKNEALFCESSSVRGARVASIRKMLRSCLSFHVQCNRNTLRFPSDARVIDCVSKKIVPLVPSQQYLTLSYVWGKRLTSPGNRHPSTSEGVTLPDQLPRTVADAVQLTFLLGYRYLWIDQYCINQHQELDKKHQIGEMGSIYSHSAATICALGPNDDTGIEGVSRAFRQRLVVEIHGSEYVWSGGEITDFVKQSVWSERGWTLQEVVLSPRCLFFTPQGAVMTCNTGVFNEHVTGLKSCTVSNGYVREKVLFESFKDFYMSFETKNDRPADRLTLLQIEYSRRKLSYESDALNAFEATLSQTSVPTYWGIPADPEYFLPDTGKYIRQEKQWAARKIEFSFVASLCWRTGNSHHGMTRYCEGIPSWSWVTQSSPIYVESCQYTSYLAHICIVCLNGDRVGLGTYFMQCGAQSSMPRQSQPLEVCSAMGVWRLDKTKDANKSLEIILTPPRLPDPTIDRRFHLPEGSWPLQSDVPGTIFFDAKSIKDDRGIEFSVSKFPQSGHAIFMTCHRPSGSLWLAVRRTKDGSFRREGLLYVRKWPGIGFRLNPWLSLPRSSSTTINLG